MINFDDGSISKWLRQWHGLLCQVVAIVLHNESLLMHGSMSDIFMASLVESIDVKTFL